MDARCAFRHVPRCDSLGLKFHILRCHLLSIYCIKVVGDKTTPLKHMKVSWVRIKLWIFSIYWTKHVKNLVPKPQTSKSLISSVTTDKVNTQFKNNLFVTAANHSIIAVHGQTNNNIWKNTLTNTVLPAEARFAVISTGLWGAEKATHDAENQLSRYSLDRFGLWMWRKSHG